MHVARWLLLTLTLAVPFVLTPFSHGQSARQSTLVIGSDLTDLITMDPRRLIRVLRFAHHRQPLRDARAF
jgi:hypothetical protein